MFLQRLLHGEHDPDYSVPGPSELGYVCDTDDTLWFRSYNPFYNVCSLYLNPWASFKNLPASPEMQNKPDNGT